MKQIIYVSRSLIAADRAELDRIWIQSRYNNALTGISGLLWTDGARFAQVLEGDDTAVDATLSRNLIDPRHDNLAMVLTSQVEAREFGDWSMIRPPADDIGVELEARMMRKLHALETSAAAQFASVVEGAHRLVTQ